MATIGPLADLGNPLDRRLMHVFVAGPGRGEGIAIALPDSGWIVIDGAASELGSPPILEILRVWKGDASDPVKWAFLSHPHDDHVDGFADVINSHPPEAIGLAGVHGAPSYLEILKDAPIPAASDERIKAEKVRHAFRAIRSWETKMNVAARGVNRSSSTLFARGDVTLDAIGPPPEVLREYLVKCASEPRYLKSDANRYSLILELRFGRARIVLPGDLPRTVQDKSVVPGWDELVSVAPHLAEHALLKVPHHGSREAIHPQVMASALSERAWVITPYDSARLPRVAKMDGLPAIVGTGTPVFLTAVPLARRYQAADDLGVVDLAQLVDRSTQQGKGHVFKDGRDVEIRPGSARESLDSVWCVSIGPDGSIEGLHRGRAALSIRRPGS